jgi:hypothetical protein
VRSLVTYYTLFVMDLGSGRVQIVGSTPHPDEAFVLQVARAATDADDGCLRATRFLISDRDTSGALPFGRHWRPPRQGQRLQEEPNSWYAPPLEHTTSSTVQPSPLAMVTASIRPGPSWV